jgi:ABC-type transport system involved in cytochrome bd biosynthesis fused ATPase/permease subunit
MSLKNNIENYFYYFQYFYNYLGYRVFIALAISLLVGFFDGVGIALFIPLLKFILDSSSGSAISMSSNPDFVSDFLLNEIGIVPDLWNIFTLIIVFFGLKGLAKFFETYIRIYFQIYFIRNLRFTNIDLLNTFSYENFLKSDLGRIQNTFSGEVNRVLSAYIYYFKSIQFNVLVIVYLSLALWSDWVFALLVIAGGIITNLFFKILYTKTKDFSTVFTTESHKFQNLLIQKVHLFKYLKATGLNRIYSTKLKKNISTMEALQLRLGFIDALLGAIKEPLTEY